MPKTTPGVYETLVTEYLATKLDGIDPKLYAVRDQLRAPEAADRIAVHLSHVIERALGQGDDQTRSDRSIELAQRIVDLIYELTGEEAAQQDRPIIPGQVLRAIQNRRPDGTPAVVSAPQTPLLDTTLLTNAPNEPRLGTQLLSEIDSADRIDVVMAFVRMSGIRPLLAALRRHCANGRSVRVLTTIYTGSTELAALQELERAGVQIRVSYDVTATRLHAKSWLFHRTSGYSTAFIGSSNLTHSAQVTGLEWNVRISGVRNPIVVRQMDAIFESYWNHQDFQPFNAVEFQKQIQAHRRPDVTFELTPVELRPEVFQTRLLEQIQLARQQGHHRNLLVAATGTGKTVMAALDYAQLRRHLPRARLLFVAHREEILLKSRSTFRLALRDATFGEEWVGGRRPIEFEHVFASIQSINSADLSLLPADHFDVVIVDEFHHAAAASYERLLSHLRPRELLGLTATPERADGLTILNWFDGRIAAELRLWDAIDQHRLVPFIYFGIHDGSDLRSVTWRRGTGYDTTELTNVLTRDHVVSGLVIRQLQRHIDNLESMHALGFCVSVEHAKFMAAQFNKAGIPSVAVWSDTPSVDRQNALRLLASGDVQVVFSVDLFNEGVDVPIVDTLLMLRPTESGTLFLQQLGRGLRKYEGKTTCTVLDFVGQHRQEFRYDKRFRALLGVTRKNLTEQLKSGFPFLPAGCHMELDRVAAEIVLDSIKRAVPESWNAKATALRDEGRETRPRLIEFLNATDLELEDVYDNDRSWSDLIETAGFEVAPTGPLEKPLRRAIGRLLHIDDIDRINHYGTWIASANAPSTEGMSAKQVRLLRMLVVSLTETPLQKQGTLEQGLEAIWAHPQVRAELTELLEVLRTRVQHVPVQLASHSNSPLSIHARYTRLEILAAAGLGAGVKTPQWREGVYWARDAKIDLLVFTLDKSSGKFSPTTRYRDYAISPSLIHWESQPGTRASSEVGKRYQNHVTTGSEVWLFARHTTDDRGFYFLGPADYVRHQSEAPMAIVWKLKTPLPGDLFASFSAAVA